MTSFIVEVKTLSTLLNLDDFILVFFDLHLLGNCLENDTLTTLMYAIYIELVLRNGSRFGMILRTFFDLDTSAFIIFTLHRLPSPSSLESYLIITFINF